MFTLQEFFMLFCLLLLQYTRCDTEKNICNFDLTINVLLLNMPYLYTVKYALEYSIIINKTINEKKTLTKKLSDRNKDSSRWKCEKPN